MLGGYAGIARLGPAPRPHRKLHCQLDYFRMRRHPGAIRFLIGYT